MTDGKTLKKDEATLGPRKRKLPVDVDVDQEKGKEDGEEEMEDGVNRWKSEKSTVKTDATVMTGAEMTIQKDLTSRIRRPCVESR